MPKSHVYTFADDTTLIIAAKDTATLQQLAQSELDNLINYFHSNNLVPNPTKTNYSIFYPSRDYDQISLKVNATILKHKTNAKLLGIIVQNNFKHHKTVNNIIRKLQPIIHSFRYANKLLPQAMMKKLYDQHVYPHLIYAITIWGTDDDKKTYIQPLIRTHKKIIRLVTNTPPRTHTRPLFAKLNTLTLTNNYIHRVCIEMHPHIFVRGNKNRPEHNHDYISTAQIHAYPTRLSQQNHQYIPNRRYGAQAAKHNMEYFTKQYSRIWNSIDPALRQIQSKHSNTGS